MVVTGGGDTVGCVCPKNEKTLKENKLDRTHRRAGGKYVAGRWRDVGILQICSGHLVMESCQKLVTEHPQRPQVQRRKKKGLLRRYVVVSQWFGAEEMGSRGLFRESGRCFA